MRECLERTILTIHAAIEPRIIDGHGDAGSDQLQQSAILLAIGAQASGLQIDNAHQFAAREHGDGELGLYGVQSGEVARIVMNVGREHRLTSGGRGAGKTFAERDHQVSHHFLTMADGIADAQAVLALAIQQDREQVVRDNVLHDGGDVRQNAIQVERLRCCGGNVEEKVEQFGAFLKTNSRFTGHFAGGRRHGQVADSEVCAADRAAAMILTLELAPMRVAPAASILSRSSKVRIPPDAFTPMSGPTVRRISSTSGTVAPEEPKPVDVFTKSAPAVCASLHATIF